MTTIDFDRNTVRSMAKRYGEESDETSTRIDRYMIDTQVAYEPEFAPTDQLEDAIAAWDESRTKA